MEHQYDLVVIGAGPGGYLAAIKAAKLGKKVAIIEKQKLGGTCLNRGCIPTKTLLHTTGLYREIRSSEAIGIRCQTPELDLSALWEHKDQVVRGLEDGIRQMMKKHQVTVYEGSGKIQAPGIVEVHEKDGKTETVTTAYTLIATGSKPARLPVPGADLDGIMNSDTILAEHHLGGNGGTCCKHLLIVGGGVIGMEMAAVYSDLGSRVTVLEAMDRIVPGMDKEIAQNLKMIMKKRGVEIHTAARVTEFIRDGETFVCRYEEKGQPCEVKADGVLLSVGRQPDTEALFSESMQQAIRTEKGYLCVNEHFETDVPGIYAIGDVIGGIQLAHMATAEGYRAVEHMFGCSFSQNLKVIPSCVYTDPEIACAGMTAEDAKQAGIPVKTAKYMMSVNGKSVLTRQERGFIKLVADEATGKLLGAQLMCARATDMIMELVVAIVNGLTVKEVASAVAAHPTFSEGITEAAEDLQNQY